MQNFVIDDIVMIWQLMYDVVVDDVRYLTC
jgi:hypothetical protein